MMDRGKYDERRRELRQRRPQHYCPHCTSVLYEEDPECVECGAQRPPANWSLLNEGFDPCLGRILNDRYLVTRFLGVGGTGNVYRAESITIQRQFAIKIIDANREDRVGGAEKIRTRLEREIEALSRLRNPHIVPFYEVLELPGNFLGVVMDYIEGVTLENLVHESGPLSIDRTCSISRQIAIGVHEAHEAGMTHRDLKPENVMIERLPLGDEFAHILDFGIVHLGDEMQVTQGFLGTPLYASPEQAMGHSVDRRSDIYSLGAVLYFMLSGRPPFVGNNSFEVLDAHIRKPPPRFAEIIPARRLPEGVETLVRKMLAKRPEKRPADLSEVIAALDELRAQVEGAGEEHFQPGALDSAEVLALDLNQTQPGRPASPNDDSSVGVVSTEQMNRMSDPAQSEPGALAPPRAEILRKSGPSGRYRSPKASDDPAPTHGGPPAITRTGTTDLTLVGKLPTGDPAFCALSPSGQVILIDPRNRLWTLAPNNPTKARRVFSAKGEVVALATMRDAVLIGLGDGAVEYVSLTSGASRQPFGNLKGNQISAIATDPGGRLTLVGTQSGRVFRGLGGHRRNALNSIQAGESVTALAVNNEGDTFAVARSDGSVGIYNVGAVRTPFSTLMLDGMSVRQMAFSLDGHILALVLPSERTVHLHHVFTGHRLMSYAGSSGRLMGVQFSDDNELLGLSMSDGQIFTWDLQRTMVALPR